MTDSSACPEGFEPLQGGGYNDYIGQYFVQPWQEGMSEMRLAFSVEDRHLNSGGTTHGGLLMSVMDTSCGAGVAHAVGRPGSTISLNCDFISGARAGDRLDISVKVTKTTRTVAFVEGRIESGDRLLMTGQGIWRVRPKEKRK